MYVCMYVYIIFGPKIRVLNQPVQGWGSTVVDCPDQLCFFFASSQTIEQLKAWKILRENVI